MKRPAVTIKGGLRVNESSEGETLEQQIERYVNNKEPIEGEAPLTYTERQEGVKPEFNIRTDRFEIAIEATTKIHASYAARREESRAARAEKDGKPDPIHGKEDTTA